MTFNRLARAIISLDPDLYLHATERVFSIGTEEEKLQHLTTNSVSDMPHPLWLWWHHLTVESLEPQSWEPWATDNPASFANGLFTIFVTSFSFFVLSHSWVSFLFACRAETFVSEQRGYQNAWLTINEVGSCSLIEQPRC